jgi:hypothetical protein
MAPRGARGESGRTREAESGLARYPIAMARRLWVLWSICFAALAALLAVAHGVAGRPRPWHPAQTAVAGFVLALLALALGVSTFAAREKLAEIRAATPAPASLARTRGLLLALWTRCLVIGAFGCLLAYGGGSPVTAWPFVSAAAVLLVLHAPRAGLFTPPAA